LAKAAPLPVDDVGVGVAVGLGDGVGVTVGVGEGKAATGAGASSDPQAERSKNAVDIRPIVLLVRDAPLIKAIRKLCDIILITYNKRSRSLPIA